MKKKEYVISLVIEPALVSVGGEVTKVKLPDGCKGISFVFKDEISMVKWYGRLVDYATVQEK